MKVLGVNFFLKHSVVIMITTMVDSTKVLFQLFYEIEILIPGDSPNIFSRQNVEF